MTTDTRPTFPQHARSRDDLLGQLDAIAERDMNDLVARFCSGAVYPAGEDVRDIAIEAYTRFVTTSGMIPRYWPSVARLESEVVAMTANLLHGATATGNVTTGGTESILLGVKIARDRARAMRPDITNPEMVLPTTAHPAFTKAAHYFGLRVVTVDIESDFTLDVEQCRRAVTDQTVLIVGSAPNVFLGTIDPISDLSDIARERNVSLHVDSCIGGFFLPFAERLGYPIPPFDFRLPGVTTISADLHKFGYVATKGASVLLSRDVDVYEFQGFEFGLPDRARGWFRTPTIPGTRTGGAIAASWAVLQYLGCEGYLERARTTMKMVDRIRDRVARIKGLAILGKPAMSVFAIAADEFDIFDVATILEDKGWLPKRDTWPRRLIRFMQSPGHALHVDRFLDDLEVACLAARNRSDLHESEASYV